MNGYYNAMRAAGIMVREEYIRKGDFTVDTAYHEAMILCRLPDPPTAIFSFNYDTTYGCLKAFAELNLRVGEDIALIGFDDIEELEHLHYNLQWLAGCAAYGETCGKTAVETNYTGGNEKRNNNSFCGNRTDFKRV